MKINLKIQDYWFNISIDHEGSKRHIEFQMIPGEKENLELETGEFFCNSQSSGSNLPFYLTVYETDTNVEKIGSEEKDKYIGVIQYYEKIKSNDGIVDSPSQIISSVVIPSKDFSDLLDNLNRGLVPKSITLERDFSIHDKDNPINPKGYLGHCSTWFNSDEENRMVLIHRVGFGYWDILETENETEIEENKVETNLLSIEERMIHLHETVKSTENVLNMIFKGIIWGMLILTTVLLWL